MPGRAAGGLEVIETGLNRVGFHHLYLHVPFCRHKCGYCDFNAYAGLDGLIEPYMRALAAELSSAVSERPFGMLSTVYFGGGTPSLVAPEHIATILDLLRAEVGIAADAEITLEANPVSTDPERLETWLRAGVNRLSLGVQGFDPRALAVLERRTDGALARRAVAEARSAGFKNLSLDLIYGVPYQSLDSWQRTVESALELEPEHLSLYCLTVEEGTPLHSRVRQGALEAVDADRQVEFLDRSRSSLTGAGFLRYEVSSWSRSGFQSRHNLSYWSCRPVYGAGCGAHSYDRSANGAQRWWNVSSPREYISSVASGRFVADGESLDLERRTAEEVMLALRTTAGLRIPDGYDDRLRRLESAGLLTIEAGVARTTERGLDLHNQIAMAVL